MRTKVARATSVANRVVELDRKVIEPESSYRGDPRVRFRFLAIAGVGTFQVAVQCECGRWWGWVHEDRLAEFRELLEGGCKSCRK